MPIPRIKLEYSISLGTLGSAVTVIFAIACAWYGLKNNVADGKTISDARYNEFLVYKSNSDEEKKTFSLDMKEGLKEIRDDIKETNKRLDRIILKQNH